MREVILEVFISNSQSEVTTTTTTTSTTTLASGVGSDQDWDFCSTETPCTLGQGDCDHDEECDEDLVCGDDNCQQDFSDRAHEETDCCIQGASASLRKALIRK